MGSQSLTKGRSDVSQEIATNMQVSHFFSVGSTISNWNINQRPRQAKFDALSTLSVVRTLSDLPIFSKCPNFCRKLTFFAFLEEFLSSREHEVPISIKIGRNVKLSRTYHIRPENANTYHFVSKYFTKITENLKINFF